MTTQKMSQMGKNDIIHRVSSVEVGPGSTCDTQLIFLLYTDNDTLGSLGVAWCYLVTEYLTTGRTHTDLFSHSRNGQRIIPSMFIQRSFYNQTTQGIYPMIPGSSVVCMQQITSGEYLRNLTCDLMRSGLPGLRSKDCFSPGVCWQVVFIASAFL